MSKRKIDASSFELHGKRTCLSLDTAPNAIDNLTPAIATTRVVAGFDSPTSVSSDSFALVDNSDTYSTAPTTPSSRRHPSDNKTLACGHPGCPKTFNRPSRLQAHLRSHNNERPYACRHPGCGKTYIEDKHLRTHIKGSHTSDRAYGCPMPGCGKAFLNGTRLRRHQAVHDGEERHRCREHPPCEKAFRKRATLQRHVRTEHLGLKPFVCEVGADQGGTGGCAQGFDSAGTLKRHQDREHSKPRFWCHECTEQARLDGRPGIGFTQLSALQAHEREEHRECMFCDFRSKARYELERHFELHHSGVPVSARKAIECEYAGCPKTFTRKSNLNHHVKTAHLGFRFVCGQVDLGRGDGFVGWDWQKAGCGEPFVTKANLESHVKYVHLKMERPPPAARNAGEGDMLDVLAGVMDDSKRNIGCPVSGCTARFIRHHDLEAHLGEHPTAISQSRPTDYGNESGTGRTGDPRLDLDISEGEGMAAYLPADVPSSFFGPEVELNLAALLELEPMSSLASEANGNFERDPMAAGPNPNAREMYNGDGVPASYNEHSVDPDTFWIGARLDFDGAQRVLQDEEWRRDEAQMRILIDQMDDDAVCLDIDPALKD